MSRRKEEYHEFRVLEKKHESDKAYLFQIHGVEEPVWVPKSQCDYDEGSSVVHVSDWIMKQKAELLAARDMQ